MSVVYKMKTLYVHAVKCYSALVVLLLFASGALTWRYFYCKARRLQGDLGDPAPTLSTEDPQSARFANDPRQPHQWFDQYLDHFDATNNQTWKQRFRTNIANYVTGGPVFLMIAGESEANGLWMTRGAWIQYARKHNALCFQLEHRFYGQSRPTEDLSIQNLKYLSSEQALADLANFIVAMNEKYQLDIDTVKWIAFGGSYAGSLAAWLRVKYPHLLFAAVSSSAPLLAKADFREFYETLSQSLYTYSENCAHAVRESLEQVETHLKLDEGRRQLREQFQLCDELCDVYEKSSEDSLDISNLFERLLSKIAGFVQKYAHDAIEEICDIMMNTTTGNQVTRLAVVNQRLLDEKNELCMDYKYDKMIAEIKDTSWMSKFAKGVRQWTYQTCTEFGFYQTVDNASDSIFGNRFGVDFFIKQCSDIYGSQFNATLLAKAIQRTNTFYGGLNIHSTNVIFVHGSMDPWHVLGLINSTDPKIPTIFIQGSFHCADRHDQIEDDSLQLIEARVTIDKFLASVIKKK